MSEIGSGIQEPPAVTEPGGAGDQATLGGQGVTAQSGGTAAVVIGPNSLAVGSRGDNAKVEVTHFYEAAKPRQRPPRAAHFAGREKELTQLLADLQPGRVVTLCGPGGIGKTALAAEAVEHPDVTARFPDGFIFHSFYNQPQAALALEGIALAYGEEPRPTPAKAALRVLAGRRALLLLDGAEDADNLEAVLQVRGGCGVLITSRNRGDAADPAQRRDIHPLPLADALTLLQALFPLPAGEIASAGRICQVVGGLPLAVQLAGRYLSANEEPPVAYLQWLETTPIAALSHGAHREKSVGILLQRSLAQVSEAAREVLGVVGLLAMAPFGLEPVRAALGLAEEQLRPPLAELGSYGLLSRTGELYQVTHALIHTYARQPGLPQAGTLLRLAGYYTALAEVESAKGREGYHRLEAERTHLLRVLAGCVERGEWEAGRTLAWAVDSYLNLCGYPTEWVTALESGVQVARRLNHRRDEGVFLGNLGLAYSDLGQVERALEFYQQALGIAREIGNRRIEGAILGNLGIAYRDLGQVERALECLKQALTIFKKIKSPYAEQARRALAKLGKNDQRTAPKRSLPPP